MHYLEKFFNSGMRCTAFFKNNKVIVHTCAKLTLSHFVPLVNVLKAAAPSNIPEGVPRNAIQFTIEDPFVPRPDSNKHTRKLL